MYVNMYLYMYVRVYIYIYIYAFDSLGQPMNLRASGRCKVLSWLRATSPISPNNRKEYAWAGVAHVWK